MSFHLLQELPSGAAEDWLEEFERVAELFVFDAQGVQYSIIRCGQNRIVGFDASQALMQQQWQNMPQLMRRLASFQAAGAFCGPLGKAPKPAKETGVAFGIQ